MRRGMGAIQANLPRSWQLRLATVYTNQSRYFPVPAIFLSEKMNSNNKSNKIKDWLLYIEDDKVKAFDITGGENADELVQLCHETGRKVVGFVAFVHEGDATRYGEMLSS